MHNYHEMNGAFPPACIADENGRPMHSWRVLLLPFIEGGTLADQYDFSQPWDSPHNMKLLPHRPAVYELRSNEGASPTTTNYVAIVGEGTMWPYGDSVSTQQISDGLSQTIMVAENLGANIPWTAPRDLELETMELSLAAESPRGISSRYDPPAVAMADGAVRTLPMNLTPAALQALISIAGGEELNMDGDGILLIDDGRKRPLKP